MITKYHSKKIEVITNSVLLTQELISAGVVYKVTIGNAQTKGNINVNIVMIIEFAECECPYCIEAAKIIDEIPPIYGDELLFAFRDFPHEVSHPNTYKATKSSHCAKDQEKIWEMHKLLYDNQKYLEIVGLIGYPSKISPNIDIFTTCLDKGKNIERIHQDISDGESYQVNGIPTFFVHRDRVVGVYLLQ